MAGQAGAGSPAATASLTGPRSLPSSQDPRGEATASAGALGRRFAATPRLVCEALARALSAGDLDAALACFAPGACLVAPGGSALYGEAPIRVLLAQLIASRAEIVIELSGVLVAGEVALAHESWTIRADGAAPFRSPATTDPTLVLRRIEDDWKLAIAAPWGAAPTPPLQAI